MTTNQKNKNLELPTITYTPDSGLRSPIRMLRQMFLDLKNARELAWRLAVRDISATYRQSLFGILWAFLGPVISALLFIFLNNQKILNVGKTDIPYPVFVMFGTLLWGLFSESINAPMTAVTANMSILSKIYFPREAIILSAILKVLFNFGIKLIILVIFFIIFGLRFTPGILLSPFAILMLMLMGIALGLLITPIGILYKDVSTVLSAFMGLWFYLTPVIYPVPNTWPMSLMSTWNPVSPVLVAARDLATKGTLQDPMLFLIVSAATLVILLIAWIMYRLALPILIERMSA
ncbi:MAG: ABC transporter permease [Anaerolineae bacterium]|nr:ABC transporter permease [Anaerolineae bacterium]